MDQPKEKKGFEEHIEELKASVCGACGNNDVYQISQDPEKKQPFVHVKVVDGYHWFCRPCKNCRKRILILEDGDKFIRIGPDGVHQGGRCGEGKEITRMQINQIAWRWNWGWDMERKYVYPPLPF